MTTDSLLDGALDNPAGAVSALLQQLVGPAMTGELATLLADRLVGAFAEGAGDPARQELAERNTVLAAALGACDCWGELADCELCGGAGASGWARPDRAAFDLYVAPALRIFDRTTTKGTES